MAKEMKMEEEEEAPIHGDILESILSHVPLIDLALACQVSKTWNRTVFSSLRHLNPVRPWLIVHAQSTGHPYLTTIHAYDPRSNIWVEIAQPPIERVSTLRSSHSALLYMHSPFKLAFSIDPLHTTWNRLDTQLAWRNDPIVALVDHRVVVAGGSCDFSGDQFPMEIYDMRTGIWDMCKSFPAIFVDSATSSCLSIAANEHKLYVTEKSSGLTYSFDPSTTTWHGPYDMRPGNNVFSSVIGFVNDRMVVVGLIGDAEHVEGVKLWEVKGEFLELSEMCEMPKELVEKLNKGEGLTLPSIAMTSTGDLAYFHNPSAPGELILCEVANGVCKWGSVRNAVVNDATRKLRFVFTCSKVGLKDLRELRSGNRRFTVKDMA
ncbi:hypothetical protein CJ030_MR7G024242 [Morella rubra]|uniref:F-box domain-containing protein n=1 Tax=Morella rubra TaxID=262757 RepID=A0A6A1V9N5_9ROSI|nr:hypothetical protein CJ030_MR7G024242 [Morella rubra]